MLYLIYCVGRFASGFVHHSAYYISLRLTACPIYCVLVLHLLGSTRTSSTGANLIFLSVFYIYGLRSIRSKGWTQRPRSTSAPLVWVPTDVSVLENRSRISHVTFESSSLVVEVFQFYSRSIWIHLCHPHPPQEGAPVTCPLWIHSGGFCLAQGAISHGEICSQVRLCCQESQRDCRVMAGQDAHL